MGSAPNSGSRYGPWGGMKAAPELRLRINATDAVADARSAQAEWAGVPLRERLAHIRRFRQALSESASEVLGMFPESLQRSRVDSLTAEIFPLLAACRFLEREAARILRPRRLPASWLHRVEIELIRDPLGVVLIIAPSNYPLFLPGVQTVQALAAGNAVVWKPGRGGQAVARAFELLLRSAGVPQGVVQVLDDSIESGTEALAAGVDKVLVTGSLVAGEAILAEAGERIVPAVAELSGNDAAVVLASADLTRAARAIAFGLRLNGGNTCIAPRRIFAEQPVARRLEALISDALGACIEVSVLPFDAEDEAIELANLGPFALGASVFADDETARRIASQLCCGVVVINDVIVPTADPRLPFGGRRHSGFGKTRGAEGLLELTFLKAIASQRGRRLRHLEPLPARAEELMLRYLQATNARGISSRLGHWSELLRVAARMRKGNK